MVYLLMGHTLYLTFMSLLELEFRYRFRSEEQCWRWVLRRISLILDGNCLREATKISPDNAWLIPLEMVGRLLSVGVEIASTASGDAFFSVYTDQVRIE